MITSLRGEEGKLKKKNLERQEMLGFGCGNLARFALRNELVIQSSNLLLQVTNLIDVGPLNI